jgi:hypothetical protein
VAAGECRNVEGVDLKPGEVGAELPLVCFLLAIPLPGEAIMSRNTPFGAGEADALSVDFPPVPNGIDYLSEVVARLARPDVEITPRDLKYAVLHLQAATEVLIKARLQIEHWSLVVMDIGKCTKEKYNKGEFQSATVTESMRRLTDILQLPIRKEDRQAVEELAKFRNRLQHWGLQETVALVEKQAASVLDFLMRFVDEHLLPELALEDLATLRKEIELVRRGVRDIDTYVETRRARLREELRNYGGCTVECPSCHEWALVVDGKDNKCHFCPATWDSESLAHAYTQNYARGDVHEDVASGDCPKCLTRALIIGARTAVAQDQRINMCLQCADVFSGLRLCSCHEWFIPIEDEDICQSCYDLYMELGGAY